MAKLVAGLFLLCAASVACCQGRTGQWVHETRQDPLHAETQEFFTLTGHFVTPPRALEAGAAPELTVVCVDHKVRQSFFSVGAVLDSKRSEVRLDGKKQALFDTNGLSSDGTSVFFSRLDLGKVLVGKSLLVGVEQYLGNQVVMQFDIPDPSPVFDACRADRFLRLVKR